MPCTIFNKSLINGDCVRCLCKILISGYHHARMYKIYAVKGEVGYKMIKISCFAIITFLERECLSSSELIICVPSESSLISTLRSMQKEWFTWLMYFAECMLYIMIERVPSSGTCKPIQRRIYICFMLRISAISFRKWTCVCLIAGITIYTGWYT